MIRPDKLEDEKMVRGMSIKKIVSSLEPEQNKIDKRILFELTGMRLDKDE